MQDEAEYELWREKWRITEWKDDSVYKTEKFDEGWWPMAEVNANLPRETNVIFVRGGVNAPLTAIRRKRIAPLPGFTNPITAQPRPDDWSEGREY